MWLIACMATVAGVALFFMAVLSYGGSRIVPLSRGVLGSGYWLLALLAWTLETNFVSAVQGWLVTTLFAAVVLLLLSDWAVLWLKRLCDVFRVGSW